MRAYYHHMYLWITQGFQPMSIYRARDIFQAKKIIIVTQKYHLYRALYVADKLGLEAYGVASNPASIRDNAP